MIGAVVGLIILAAIRLVIVAAQVRFKCIRPFCIISFSELGQERTNTKFPLNFDINIAILACPSIGTRIILDEGERKITINERVCIV
jgi:hypothetical protein